MTWPTHADGSAKRIGEMTPEERARVTTDSAKKFEKELQAAAPALAEVLNADPKDPKTWRRIGSTTDGLPVLDNPGNGMASVQDPITRDWYSPMAYETVRVGRVKAAAEDLFNALEQLLLHPMSLEHRERAHAAIAKAQPVPPRRAS